jgi:hypothetical protein
VSLIGLSAHIRPVSHVACHVDLLIHAAHVLEEIHPLSMRRKNEGKQDPRHVHFWAVTCLGRSILPWRCSSPISKTLFLHQLLIHAASPHRQQPSRQARTQGLCRQVLGACRPMSVFTSESVVVQLLFAPRVAIRFCHTQQKQADC